MKKFVDGKTIDMTAEEIKVRQAEEKEWADGAPARNLSSLRVVRDRKLAETDWMSLPDAPTITDEWKKYRQELRDITKTYKTLDDVKWPEEPAS